MDNSTNNISDILENSNVAEDYELLMNTMKVSVSKHLLDEHFTIEYETLSA